MNGQIVIHGHFYQPPRENPWLGTLPREPAAAPFPNWNARIERECYGPNGWARLLADDGRIRAIVSNYARLSFDLGPTLGRWLERERAETHARIVEAARAGGQPIAQAYHHAILPLLDARDRRTEILWAIADFRRRFGRAPRGLWLPECAVDLATLGSLASCGIRYTIVTSRQIERVRVGDGPWERADPARLAQLGALRQRLPGGGEIVLLVADADLGGEIAFGDLLHNGDRLADRLLGLARERPLVLVATDGETFGHHKRFGEMALARALERIEAAGALGRSADLLAPGAVRAEAVVREGSSWSCVHGLERWRSACSCGRAPGGHTRWRAPLRAAFDALRERVDRLFEREGAGLLGDPWRARDAYGERVVAGPEGDPAGWLAAHAHRALDPEARCRALELLEMQRHRLAMYMSCAWFFDDIARPEPALAMSHATRAAEIAERHGESGLVAALVRALADAPGNDPREPDGAAVWRARVVPLRHDPLRLAAHAAVAAAAGVASAFVSREHEVRVEGAGRERTVEIRERRTGCVRRLPVATEAGADGLWRARVAGGGPGGERAFEWTELDAAMRERIAFAREVRIARGVERALAPLFTAENWAWLRRAGDARPGALASHALWHAATAQTALAIGTILETRPLDRARLEPLLGRARQLAAWLEDAPELRHVLEPVWRGALERSARELEGEPAAADTLLWLLEAAGRLGLAPDLWRTRNRVWEVLQRGGIERETQRRLQDVLGFAPGKADRGKDR